MSWSTEGSLPRRRALRSSRFGGSVVQAPNSTIATSHRSLSAQWTCDWTTIGRVEDSTPGWGVDRKVFRRSEKLGTTFPHRPGLFCFCKRSHCPACGFKVFIICPSETEETRQHLQVARSSCVVSADSAWHSCSLSEASYDIFHPEAIYRAQEHHQDRCTDEHQQGVSQGFLRRRPFQCFSQPGFFLDECFGGFHDGPPSTCLFPRLPGRLHDPGPRGPCTSSSHQPGCTDGWFRPRHARRNLSCFPFRFDTCLCHAHASSTPPRCLLRSREGPNRVQRRHERCASHPHSRRTVGHRSPREFLLSKGSGTWVAEEGQVGGMN